MKRRSTDNWVSSTIKIFREKCDSEISKGDQKTKVPNTLYHYTSLKNLHSILQTRSFYFANYNSLKDDSEIKYGLEIAKNFTEKLEFEKSSFFNTLTSFIKNPQNINFYIFCVSEIYTNSYLWKEYADDGYGVVIGVGSGFALELELNEECPELGIMSYCQIWCMPKISSGGLPVCLFNNLYPVFKLNVINNKF